MAILKIVLLAIVVLSNAQEDVGMEREESPWDNHYIFRGVCRLDWKVDVENKIVHMRFEAHNPGWIGIGWGPVDGKMQYADMAIMTRKNGDFVIEDYYSEGFITPILDEHNDLEQISAGQDGSTTWMEFKRPFVTEDGMDKPITQGSMRLVWALGRGIDSLEIHSEKGSDDVILWPFTAGDYSQGPAFPLYPIKPPSGQLLPTEAMQTMPELTDTQVVEEVPRKTRDQLLEERANDIRSRELNDMFDPLKGPIRDEELLAEDEEMGMDEMELIEEPENTQLTQVIVNTVDEDIPTIETNDKNIEKETVAVKPQAKGRLPKLSAMGGIPTKYFNALASLYSAYGLSPYTLMNSFNPTIKNPSTRQQITKPNVVPNFLKKNQYQNHGGIVRSKRRNRSN